MTVRFQRVYTSIWRDLRYEGCTEDETFLFVHILTSPQSNMIGLFYCTRNRLLDDLPRYWTPQRLGPPLQGLIEKGLVLYDEGCQHILNPYVWRENPLQNPNQVKAAVKLLQHIPDTALLSYLLELVKKLKVSMLNPFGDALRERLGKRLPTRSGNRSGNRSVNRSGIRLVSGFETKEKEKEK